jgi:NADH-quinone oxidoreductase subunit N
MNPMNWLAIYPEMLLLGLSCLVAMLDLWVQSPRRTATYWFTQLSLLAVCSVHTHYVFNEPASYAMNRMVVSDAMGHLLAAFATLSVMIALVYARVYAGERDMLKGELFTLSMFSLLGISIMLCSNHFLMVYLGLELMSLSLYALTALRRDHAPATEAAMKYFVLGALASGFLLYGLSMLYGATGSLEIRGVMSMIAASQSDPLRQIDPGVLALGLVFTVSGLAFKLGAVPFHMWVPDVYHGAPTAAALLIAGAPKLAAFAITFRLLVEGLLGLAADWQQMLMLLAVVSMLIGNLVAIAQTNIKRMLAYSAIANMGFMVLGFTPTIIDNSSLFAVNGYSSALFYVVTYVLTTLGTFGTVMLLSRKGFEADHLDHFKGLAKRSPWFATVMAVFMLSLAGLPPTVGFYAKLSVLQAIVTTQHALYIQVAIAAVVLSLIGAYYYLRVIKLMYFDEPVDVHPLQAGADMKVVLSLNAVAVLALGLFPNTLMKLCADVMLKAFQT